MVLLNFGSHFYCGLCHEIYPVMRELTRPFDGRPLVVISINAEPEKDLLGWVAIRPDRPDEPGAAAAGPAVLLTLVGTDVILSGKVLTDAPLREFMESIPADGRSFGFTRSLGFLSGSTEVPGGTESWNCVPSAEILKGKHL